MKYEMYPLTGLFILCHRWFRRFRLLCSEYKMLKMVHIMVYIPEKIIYFASSKICGYEK